MVPIPPIDAAKRRRHHLPSFSTKGAALEKTVSKKTVRKKYSSIWSGSGR